MQIVNRVQDYTSTNQTLNPPIVEGQANPIRRDTVQVPPGSSVALRIVADNPGAWMLHCLYPLFRSVHPGSDCHALQAILNGTWRPVSR